MDLYVPDGLQRCWNHHVAELKNQTIIFWHIDSTTVAWIFEKHGYFTQWFTKQKMLADVRMV